MRIAKLSRVALLASLLSACALSPIDKWFEREFDVTVKPSEQTLSKVEVINLTDDKEVKDVESFIKEATISEATVEIVSVGGENQAVSASGSLQIAADETSAPVFTSEPQSIEIKAGTKITVAVTDADKAAVGKLVLDKKKFILRYQATHNYGSTGPVGGEPAGNVGNQTAVYRVKLRAHVIVTPGL